MANTETDEVGHLTISLTLGVLKTAKAKEGGYELLMEALRWQIKDTEEKFDGEFEGIDFDEVSKSIKINFKGTTDPRSDREHNPYCKECGARKLRLTKDDKTKEKV